MNRLLAPALLATVGFISLAAGDRFAASACANHRLGHDLERARTQHPDDPLLGRFEDVVSMFSAYRADLGRFQIQLSLAFLIFSLGWALLSRESLKFRVGTFSAIWLAMLAKMATGNIC